MKCIQCGKEGARYIHREKSFYYNNPKTKREIMARKDNIAKCKHCGFEGRM